MIEAQGLARQKKGVVKSVHFVPLPEICYYPIYRAKLSGLLGVEISVMPKNQDIKLRRRYTLTFRSTSLRGLSSR